MLASGLPEEKKKKKRCLRLPALNPYTNKLAPAPAGRHHQLLQHNNTWKLSRDEPIEFWWLQLFHACIPNYTLISLVGNEICPGHKTVPSVAAQVGRDQRSSQEHVRRDPPCQQGLSCSSGSFCRLVNIPQRESDRQLVSRHGEENSFPTPSRVSYCCASTLRVPLQDMQDAATAANITLRAFEHV